jgi:predicted RNase H-like nuclease
MNEIPLVAGVDGCKAGWIAFKVELPSRKTSVELVDLPSLLRQRPPDLCCIGIDIPIGLLDGSRSCDKSARKLLGQPRGSSVFAAPCRAAVQARTYEEACAVNHTAMGTKLSQQAWGIVPKIKEVDDTVTPECQSWAVEVHPEVSFWALAGYPMQHGKKTASGKNERLDLLRKVFPEIETHLSNKPSGVSKDDLLDAAVAAWTALRIQKGEGKRVCGPERDSRRLECAIWY